MTNFVFSTNVTSVLRNNLSFAGTDKDVIHAGVDDAFNSWNLPVTVTTADISSLSVTAATGPRNSDGSLPTSNFLRLRAGSDLIDKGVSVGIPYSGNSPDLGAYERP